MTSSSSGCAHARREACRFSRADCMPWNYSTRWRVWVFWLDCFFCVWALVGLDGDDSRSSDGSDLWMEMISFVAWSMCVLTRSEEREIGLRREARDVAVSLDTTETTDVESRRDTGIGCVCSTRESRLIHTGCRTLMASSSAQGSRTYEFLCMYSVATERPGST